MANLSQSTAIGSGGLSGSYAVANTMRLGIYNYREAQEVRTTRYLHFKTNIPTNSDFMVTLEGIGYDYAGGRPIQCAWSFYVYSNNIYNVSLQKLYNGLTPNSVYRSSDNFVCISAAAQDIYYIGVTLNSYTTNTGWGRGVDVSITASATPTASGNYF